MATVAELANGIPEPGDIPLYTPLVNGPHGEFDSGSPYSGQSPQPYAQSSPSYPPWQGMGPGVWNALTLEERLVIPDSRTRMGSPPKVDYAVASPFDYAYPSTYPGPLTHTQGFTLSDPGGLFN